MVRSNQFVRVFTAIILIPFAVFIIFKGNITILYWFTATISIGSLLEYYALVGIKDFSQRFIGAIFGIIIFTCTVFFERYLFIAYAIFFCIFFSYLLLVFELEGFLKKAGEHAVGMLYFPLLSGFILKVSLLNNGRIWLFLLLLVNWATDSFAYFIGTQFGKHKLTIISPKKSVEGLIGGIFGGILSVFVVNYFFLYDHRWHFLLLLGLLGSIVGQMGDIFESAIKRSVGAKDSGNIIPGHGGFMDRFDSLYFTGPLFYLFIKYIFIDK